MFHPAMFSSFVPFFLLLLALPTPAIAENDAPINPLVAKQEMIRDRLVRLEDRMFRLREKLLDDEPDNAARLADALQRSGELGVQDRVDAVLELLGDGVRLDDAADGQDDLVKDLEAILKSLIEKPNDEEARQAEIARLEEIKADVDALRERQRELRKDTGNADENEHRAKQLADAIKRLDALIEKQEAMNKSPGDTAKSKQQSEVAEATRQLESDVRKLEQDPANDEQPPDSSSESSESAAGDLQSAAKSMSKAQAAAKTSDAPSAKAEQEKALEHLRRARQKLAEAKKAAEDAAKPDKLAKRQGETAAEAEALGKKMRGEPSNQEGKPQGGQEGGEGGKPQESQESGEPTPGQKQIEKAQGHMEDATEDLDDEKPRDATADQDKALAELDDAAEELEEALRQLRQEEQEEVLRDLEARFRAMLETQLEINTGTTEVDAVGPDNFKRAEKLRTAELADKQGKLAKEVDTCLHVLEEEGTTVVFPAVLEQLAEDMRDVESRLKELYVGVLTQAIQKEIVSTLQDLVDAVERRQQEMSEQQGRPGQPGSPDEQPLLPTSAELKLLKAMQVRVNGRTSVIEETKALADPETPHRAGAKGIESEASLRKATEGVARRQGEAANIAEEMRELESGS